MKRALTAAVFGGLVMFIVPQVASASARPVTPSDHSAEHKDCAGQPEAAHDAEQAPPKQEQRQGDREQNDDGSILF